MSNPTAGSGDPYWYEWSIGLIHIISMMNEDNNIKSVTLQSKDAQGLDDVVVKYFDNKTKCIQIKHSRIDNTITFGDLVSSSENGKSLLKVLSVAWREAKNNFGETYPTLYTNRKSGTQKATIKVSEEFSYVRPALMEFWKTIKKQIESCTTLNEINVPKEWEDAWLYWKEELSELNEHEKYNFLKALSIESDQPNLDEIGEIILKEICNIFGVDRFRATPIRNTLDSALRKWSTTERGEIEEVNREELIKVLSLDSNILIGEHELRPPYPFFSSREKLVIKLEDFLINGDKKIVFLTGNPGEGKTSIVSSLANKRNSIIDLRYHAYKPITPETPIIPADVGKTTTASALWGDLLSQLRVLFKGRLSEYNVPIFNDLLTDEELRSEVIRLADIYGRLEGRPTIIVIDGIDHAARAGQDNESFLSTLIPPEAIPECIKFLIVGQPSEGYGKYPIWLKDQREDISLWKVESILEEDIYALLKHETRLKADTLVAAARLVNDLVGGNTLSAIFAVHEAKNVQDVEELEKILIERQLHNGISIYYETIWNNAISAMEKLPLLIDASLAACLAIANDRVNGNDLEAIFSEYNLPGITWNQILLKLHPLIIKEHSAYRVLHNDVRVHLMRVISSDLSTLVDVAGKMADYYLHKKEKAIVRHNSVFKLLELSNREKEYIDVYTSEYVMEAIALNRPLQELEDQCKKVIENLPDKKSWNQLQLFSQAVSTLRQYHKITEWIVDEFEEKEELPSFLSTEIKVQDSRFWDVSIINRVIHDALRLIKENEYFRAQGVIERWFDQLNPIEIISIIGEVNILASSNQFGNEEIVLFRKLGVIYQILELDIDFKYIKEELTDFERKSLADFYGGYLLETINKNSTLKFVRSFRKIQTFYYSDIEECMYMLARERKWLELAILVRKIGNLNEVPISLKLKLYFYSLILNNNKDGLNCTEEIIQRGFSILNQNDFKKEELLNVYAMMAFIIGWEKNGRESGAISEEAVKHYYESQNSNSGKEHFQALINAAATVGIWMRSLRREKDEKCLSEGHLNHLIHVLLDNPHPNKSFVYNSIVFRRDLMELLIECTEKAGGTYTNTCYKIIKEYCSQNYPVNSFADIFWIYLYMRGESTLLIKWYDNWLGENGLAWHIDVSERLQIFNSLTKLALDTGMEDKIAKATERKNWGLISYTGHKEYVMEELIPWFEKLIRNDPKTWREEGKKVLEISQEASKVGDNRLELYVLNLMSIAVAKSGAYDMSLYYNGKNIDRSLLEEPHILLDGIIGLLEDYKLTENDALIFWVIGIGTLNWKKEIDRVYLNDLKNAILIAAERNNLSGIDEQLELLGTAEYNANGSNLRYKTPDRWYFEYKDEEDGWSDLKVKLEKSEIDSAIIELKNYKQNKFYQERFFWKGISLLCSRVQKERSINFINQRNELQQLISSTPYEWNTESIVLGYQSFIALIDEDETWQFMKTMLNVNIDWDRSYWLTPLSELLNSFSLSYADSADVEVLKLYFNQILDTHLKWINGNGFLPELKRIDFGEKSQKWDVNSWESFALYYLYNVLLTNNSSRIELALRGIWGIVQTSPEKMNAFIEQVRDADIRIKEWLLLVVEAVVILKPQVFDVFSEFVQQCYESDSLNLKLHSWIIYQALHRSTGKDFSELSFCKHSDTSVLEQIDNKGTGLLKIPDQKQGNHIALQRTGYVFTVLGYLEAATREELEDLEMKLSNYLKVSSKVNNTIHKIKMSNGESQLILIPEKLKFMDVIYHEISNGRWNHVPFLRIAQAITTGDDPMVLFNTPKPALDISDWLIDQDLDKHIEKGQESLKAVFLENINSGISEEEIVLGAILHTYSHKKDVVFSFQQILEEEVLLLNKTQLSRVYSGRSYSYYETNRFDPIYEYFDVPFQMTYQTGGISYFNDQNILISPSFLWADLFGWETSHIPTKWTYKGEEVVRLEYFYGPYRELYNGPIDRQPILQRWVCNKAIFEEALEKNALHSKPYSEVIVY